MAGIAKIYLVLFHNVFHLITKREPFRPGVVAATLFIIGETAYLASNSQHASKQMRGRFAYKITWIASCSSQYGVPAGASARDASTTALTGMIAVKLSPKDSSNS